MTRKSPEEESSGGRNPCSGPGVGGGIFHKAQGLKEEFALGSRTSKGIPSKAQVLIKDPFLKLRD